MSETYCKIIEADVRELHEVKLESYRGQLEHRLKREGGEFTPWNGKDVPDVPSGCLNFAIESDYGTRKNLQVCALGYDNNIYHCVRHYDNGYWTPMRSTADEGTGQPPGIINNVSCKELNRNQLEVRINISESPPIPPYRSFRDEVTGKWTRWERMPQGSVSYPKETNCRF